MSSALNGKYVLDHRLGGGGMAEVFLARTVGAQGFTRQVAIKRVLPGFASDPRFAALFISEAQVTSRPGAIPKRGTRDLVSRRNQIAFRDGIDKAWNR